MAIEWKVGRNSAEYKDETTHEGLVVVGTYTRLERVMSDMWETVRYCMVWDPETSSFEEKSLGCHDLTVRVGTATVDAPPEVLEAYEAEQAAKQATKEHLAAERAALSARKRMETEWHSPKHGKIMQVVRGRKVPKGTIGKVFWMRDGRVGLALSDARDARGNYANVAWVDARYLQNVDPHPVLDAEALAA
jgi:hypothetical protein